jgi:hypothetical protein
MAPPGRASAALLAGAGALALLGASPPAQPFRFSHKVHAGDERIGCTSCHAYAERGPVAGVPSMARCQGCHKFVKEDKENAQLDQELKALLHASSTRRRREARVQGLPRRGREDGRGAAGVAAHHGLVPRLPQEPAQRDEGPDRLLGLPQVRTTWPTRA